MSIIRFNPYKNLDDSELFKKAYDQIDIIQRLFENNEDKIYKEECIRFNSIIIEMKSRNIKINKKDILMRILFR